MASLHVTQLRASGTMIQKTTCEIEEIPRKSIRGFLGSGGTRHSGPLQSITDFRTGENFNHLKLTAEKMMLEQASLKSDLQILKTKLQKSEEQVRTLEAKEQDINTENAMLKVKHKQGMKLWKGLDSKFLATTTYCDQLAETLQLLDSQVQEGERSKTFLEEKLTERLKFFEDTRYQLRDLEHNKEVAEDAMKECEARNVKLHHTLQELEQKLVSESIKFQSLAVEKDDLLQQLTKALRTNEDNTALIRSTRSDIQDLQKEIAQKAQEAVNLQHLNLTLMQGKGELELQVKDLQNLLATAMKEKETLEQKSETLQFKICDLEKVNASAAVNIEDLLAEKAKCNQQTEEDKLVHAKVVTELKQHIVENKMDAELIKHQLHEAIKENERLVKVVAEDGSKFASLQSEANQLRQECTEKNRVISHMSQHEESIKREMKEMQETLTGVENDAKNLQQNFKLQLEAKQTELGKHLQEISQRNNEEMADMRRNCETETRDAIAKERFKGEAAINAVKQASAEGLAKEREASNQRQKRTQEDHDHEISKLRQDYDYEKSKIAAFHAGELHKNQVELEASNQRRQKRVQEDHDNRISKLRQDHDQEKLKIAAIHAEELQKKQEELEAFNQRRQKRVEEDYDHRISKLLQGHDQEKSKIVALHAEELQKKQVELEASNQRQKRAQEDHDYGISKLRQGHDQEKSKIAALHAEELQIKQVQFHTEQEKRAASLAKLNELQVTIEELKKFHQEEIQKYRQDYHNHLLKEAMKEMQLAHKEELLKRTQEQKAQCDILEKHQHAQIQTLQKTLTQDIDEWRSKALLWENQLQEALKIAAKVVSKEDKQTQITIEELTTSDGVASKECQTLIVTPISKDREAPQQMQKSFVSESKRHCSETGNRVAIFGDTTDEDFEEGRGKLIAQDNEPILQQSQSSGKRKLGCILHRRESPASNDRTSSRKDTPDLQDEEPIQRHRTSTDLTTASNEGTLKELYNETTIAMTFKENQPFRRLQKSTLVQGSQHAMEDFQKKIRSKFTQPLPGLLPLAAGDSHQKKKTVVRTSQLHREVGCKSSQATTPPTVNTQSGSLQRPNVCSNLDSTVAVGSISAEKENVLALPLPVGMPTTNQKDLPLDGKEAAPKRGRGRPRKSTKGITREKDQPPKTLSPAISDLFQIDGLEVPYYRGDDPYAFD